ncbi:AGAP010317-PA [Anopheles gambiae str. PEST]|uniref:AGAP010317-PA n=2 Tax=gambiae species complex TaxID=44542 RepID=Q7Q0F9_ANOGA|nr:AGAP010317-PA [Anopheles gambiae str. PEST]
MNKPDCKYGAECYQQNPAHKEKFAHPVKSVAENSTVQAVTSNSGNMEIKKRSMETLNQQLEDIKRYKRLSSPEKDICYSGGKDSSYEYHDLTRQRYAVPKVPMSVGILRDIYDSQIEFSQQAEYKELCNEPKKFIKHKFLVLMPPCFEDLWQFCQVQALKTQIKPEETFLQFGLKLVGPYDVLAGKFDRAKVHEPGDYLRHWRFFYDPPEFQTIIVQQNSGVHYGYWRDSPDNTDGLVAWNDVKKGCEFLIVGENIFDAILHFLGNYASVTPFNKKKISDMKKLISDWAQSKDIALNCCEKQKSRKAQIVSKTFHKVGLVVPYDRKTNIGYRPLLESDEKIRAILSKFENLNRFENNLEYQELMRELQPIITAADLATDECDFGTVLELALDFFCSGVKSLHEVMKPLFFTGYSMVNRPQYIAIIKSHLDNRREGINLNLLAGN